MYMNKHDRERNHSYQETIRRVLSRTAESFNEIVGARSFFFLAPPFIDRGHEEYVDYYGVAGETIYGVEGVLQNAIQEEKANLLQTSTIPNGGLQLIKGILARFKHKIQANQHLREIGFNRCARSVAHQILMRSSVSIGRYTITDAGPTKTDFPTLMDYALEFTHAAEKKRFVAEANESVRHNVGSGFRFRSNSSFYADVGVDADEEHSTIWSTDSYLTWQGYVRANQSHPKNNTLEQFLAEFLYSLESPERIESSLDDGIPLESLRQTHLPLAGFGQYRASICWVSHLNRNKNKCISIVQKLDRPMQSLLSDQFSFALLEAFRVAFAEALEKKDSDANEYYRSMAHAFGLLFWSYEVEFFLNQTIVACCRDGEVKQRSSSTTDVSAFPPNNALQHLHSKENKGTTIYLHIPNLLNLERITRSGRNRLNKLDIVDVLGFNLVVCKGMFVSDTSALKGSELLIGERISSVVVDVIANVHRMMGLVSHAMGHQIKHVCTERGSQKAASMLELRIEESRQFGQDLVSIPLDEAIATASCLRSEESLFGPAEMFRRINTLQTGKLPREWMDENGMKMQMDQRLLRVRREMETTIVNMAVAYDRLIKEQYRIDDEPLAEGLLLRNPFNKSFYNLTTKRREGIPGLAFNQNIDASIAILSGLHELARNAFQETKRLAGKFLEANLIPTVWLTVESDPIVAKVTASIVNISMNESVRSRSLEALEEIGRRLGCVTICKPRILENKLDNTEGIVGVKFIESSFTLHLSKFHFKKT